MKFLVNKKLVTRIGIITTIITLAGMILLWLIVSTNAASMVKNDITNQMTDAVESRAAIINEYVSTAEEYMAAFALASEVHELLQNPTDNDLLKKAQSYTEDFASVKGIFEGLYIATPDTYVLTHTSKDAIGITTRSGESLDTFQNTILAKQQLTNLGIMKSPGTGSMILSMYCPIFENGSCIGYVGAGVYASRLMDALLNLNIEGLPNSEYVFLNAKTGVYLYHEDESLLNTETADSGYLEIIKRVETNKDAKASTYSYRDEEDIKHLVVYKFLKDRDWIFMVRDSETEVYGSVTTVRVLVGGLCAAMGVIITLVTLFILHREGKELMAVEHALHNLGDLNLSADKELEVFYGRSDEIGMIAKTTHRVCGCLKQTIDDVGRILGEMANGNLTVNVTENERYYIGDFKVLSESLITIHSNLTSVIRDISSVANQVDMSADRVSTEAEALSQGTMEQAVSVDNVVSNVTSITSQLQNSAQHCGNANELVAKAAGYATEADKKMEQLKASTTNIEESSTKIVTIIKTIEDISYQTNILSLNASVEAARAGTAGRGFSVVADEVRKLAVKSSEAAQNTSDLIKHSIQDVKTGTESTSHAVSAMQIINDCIQSIKTRMDEIAAASIQQSEMIVLVENGMKEISEVVQTNTASAKESAEVSKELSAQARTLNSLISRFRIR